MMLILSPEEQIATLTATYTLLQFLEEFDDDTDPEVTELCACVRGVGQRIHELMRLLDPAQPSTP